jgi:hypothetical protein
MMNEREGLIKDTIFKDERLIDPKRSMAVLKRRRFNFLMVLSKL